MTSARSEKKLLCRLMRSFYRQGWCTGTGGGISIKVEGGYLMAPSGVAKELLRPKDIFELDASFEVQNGVELRGLKLTECAPLFRAIFEKRGAGAVIHTHGVQLVLAMHQTREHELVWEKLEMIKGIRGGSYLDRHRVPIIANTPKECDLLASLTEALDRLPPNAHGVFVRDHGAYIWGRDTMEAKRHVEIYDWLCQFSNAEKGVHGARL